MRLICFHNFSVAPKTLQIVKLSHFIMKYVNHHCAIIEKDPGRFIASFDMERTNPLMFEMFDYAVCQRADMAIGSSVNQNKELGNVRQFTNIEDERILSFFRFAGFVYERRKFFRIQTIFPNSEGFVSIANRRHNRPSFDLYGLRDDTE